AVGVARRLLRLWNDGDAEPLCAARRAGHRPPFGEIVDQITAANLVLADTEPRPVREPERLGRVVVDERVRAPFRTLFARRIGVDETCRIAGDLDGRELAV